MYVPRTEIDFNYPYDLVTAMFVRLSRASCLELVSIFVGAPMKTYMLLTSSGPVVILTSHEFIQDAALIKKLAGKGWEKFIAFEIPNSLAEERYGGHFGVTRGDVRETDDLRVLELHPSFELVQFQGTQEAGSTDIPRTNKLIPGGGKHANGIVSLCRVLPRGCFLATRRPTHDWQPDLSRILKRKSAAWQFSWQLRVLRKEKIGKAAFIRT